MSALPVVGFPNGVPSIRIHMSHSSPHVVIIGGGPAGAATALALRRHAPAIAISLVEADNYQALRVGETLHPAAEVLLQRLGVWEHFIADAHAPSYGTVSAWGSTQPESKAFFTTRFGAGFHLDRRRFDAMLAEQAEQQGVRLLPNTRLLKAARDDETWHLQLSQAGQMLSMTANFVVDATGRRAAFARQAGACRQRFDRLIGAFQFVSVDKQAHADTRTWVEAVPYGWWYAALLPEQRVALACMSDADIIRSLGLVRRENWLQAALQTQHIRGWLHNAQLEDKPVLAPAQAGWLQPCVGPRWLAVGDAAAQFDPLSGQGLTQALRGGIAAAYAIADDLAGREQALARYAHLIGSEVKAFSQTRLQYYGMERRWLAEKFWQRRQAVVL
jgi:flavin-dependent dehydrogenase